MDFSTSVGGSMLTCYFKGCMLKFLLYLREKGERRNVRGEIIEEETKKAKPDGREEKGDGGGYKQ